MGTLMAALIKYVDSDSTKDPASDDEKTGKGKRNGNGKGQQHNPGNQGGNKRKADGNPKFVANANAQGNNQRRKGKLLDPAGQAHLLNSYSMSPARNTAPGSTPPHTYGRIM